MAVGSGVDALTSSGVAADTVVSTPVPLPIAVQQALDEAMAADSSVICLGEDISDGEGGGPFMATAGLSTRYGTDRVRTTPISEQAIIGAAIGASMAGYRPVAEIMIANFLTVAMDQIVNHAAKLRFMSGGQTPVPITIRTAGVGVGVGAQHSDFYEAWLAHSPGLKVVVPSSSADAKGLLLSCIDDDDPCVFVENPRIPPSPVVSPGVKIPLGRAHVTREGGDVSVIAYGAAVSYAESVANTFASEGIGVEIVDLRSIVPLDLPTVLGSVAKTKRVVIAHEAVRSFGVGAEVASLIYEELFSELEAPIQRVGGQYTPVPYNALLAEAYRATPDKLEAAVRRVLA